MKFGSVFAALDAMGINTPLKILLLVAGFIIVMAIIWPFIE
jgi:hypothetical protein